MRHLRAPSPGPVVRRPTCWNASYERHGRDRWRDLWGEDVPDGVDLTLRAALRRAGRDGDGPLDDADRAWGRALQGVTGAPIPVEGDPEDEVVGLDAPELAPDRMLTLSDLAELLGWSLARTDSCVARGTLPQHQRVVDGGRRWSRRIVERWLRR